MSPRESSDGTTEAARSGCGGVGASPATRRSRQARRERHVVRRQQLKRLLHVLKLPDFEQADRIGEIIG
jgi:hypothetical protein